MASSASGPVDISFAVNFLLKWTKVNVNGAVSYWNTVMRTASPPVAEGLWRLLHVRMSYEEKFALRGTREGNRLLLKLQLKMMDRPTIPATPFIALHQVYDFYSGIALLNGTVQVRDSLRSGKTVLVALRKSSNTLANKGKGSYDDKIAVLQGSGYNRRASTFVACTEPGAQYSQRAAPKHGGGTADPRYAKVSFNKSVGSDVNKDGTLDAGRLIEGTYLYYEKKGGHLGDRAFEVKVTQVAERDTDGDGQFTAQDPSRTDTEGARTSMYIHRGGANDVVEPNTWSAGCQTIPKNHYKSFLSAVGTASTPFYYVLVNAGPNG